MKKLTINGEYTLEEIQKLFEEKTILKYPNGAVVEAVEDGKYFYITNNGAVDFYYFKNDLVDKYNLLIRNVFLTQEEAEKEAKRKKRYYEIINEIEKINREQEWIADWNDDNQKKWYLFYSYMSDCLNNRFVRNKAYTCRRSNIYMSEKAIDWVMSLPDEDKKILINIYD